MRTKVQSGTPPKKEVAKEERVTLPHDVTNEGVVIAACFHDEAWREKLSTRLTPEHFTDRLNRSAFQALQEAVRRKLEPDLTYVEQHAGSDVAVYVRELLEVRVDVPKNLDFHVKTLLWDSARVACARGPVPAFIESLRDPKAEPERTRTLARAIAQSFEGHEDRKYLYDGSALIRDQMREIEQRVAGRATFPYGVPGLDYYDRIGPREDWRKRMLPGAAPGQVTVVTGVSGGGKSTFTAHLALGLAFPGWMNNDFAPGRSVLYGAWEMSAGMTLEILACISLGWSRSDLMEGRGIVATAEGRVALHERMRTLAPKIRFMGNPFRRNASQKGSNQRNLDLLQGYIADSGAEVFIGDLWKRCLVETAPDDEEQALYRQQAMGEELRVHAILLQQQRGKEVEQREDKRPTREGIKGSGAWVEIADTIIGLHRPALWASIPDDTLEVFVLKQRYGQWPLGVEFRWDASTGMVKGGVPIDYDRPSETNEVNRTASLADKMRRKTRS